MIPNRQLTTASFATAIWLVMFTAVATARAQTQKRPPAAASPRTASSSSGPLFHWHMEKKTDALTDEVSTQPASMKLITGADGKLQGLVSVCAY